MLYDKGFNSSSKSIGVVVVVMVEEPMMINEDVPSRGSWRPIVFDRLNKATYMHFQRREKRLQVFKNVKRVIDLLINLLQTICWQVNKNKALKFKKKF